MPIQAGDAELVELIELTCRRSGADLIKYTDAQVAMGLDYIFNPSCSDTAFSLRSESVPVSQRLSAIQSIGTLYTDCFARRCTTAGGPTGEKVGTDLNDICYMLWDVTPIVCVGDTLDSSVYLSASLTVLQNALGLHNAACIESALHGLGHLHAFAPLEVERIIDEFLRRSSDLSLSLLRYATAARDGHVQ